MKFLLQITIALGLSVNAFALPINHIPASIVNQKSAAQYNFNGIVALNNCSGSIMRFENSLDTDNALVLTNGHCLESGMPNPGVVVQDQDSRRSFTVLSPNAASLGKVHATKVVYSTMTSTDITVYELSETYAEIKTQFNADALTLSPVHPTAGSKIEVLSGYWRKGYACSIEYFVNELREDAWTSHDSLRYSRPGCETIGGTSGSPVVLAGTRTIIGVNNTGNDAGEKCTMDNPCEIDLQGNIKFEKGVSYGQQTYWISTCVNSDRKIDLNQAGCLLPK